MPQEPLGSPRSPQFTLRSLFAVITVVALLLGITIPAVRAARDRARTNQCANNLKIIVVGLHNYMDAFDSFPPAYTVADGQRLHSWRLSTVGYLEQWGFETEEERRKTAPFQHIRWDLPWNHPQHAQLCTSFAAAYYECPADESAATSQGTSYLAITGPEAAWPGQGCLSFADFRKGTSNTILVAESAATHIKWIEPRDLELATLPLTVNDPQSLSICSLHSRGANVAMADGSTRFLPTSISPHVLQTMLKLHPNSPESTGEGTNPASDQATRASGAGTEREAGREK